MFFSDFLEQLQTFCATLYVARFCLQWIEVTDPICDSLTTHCTFLFYNGDILLTFLLIVVWKVYGT